MEAFHATPANIIARQSNIHIAQSVHTPFGEAHEQLPSLYNASIGSLSEAYDATLYQDNSPRTEAVAERECKHIATAVELQELPIISSMRVARDVEGAGSPPSTEGAGTDGDFPDQCYTIQHRRYMEFVGAKRSRNLDTNNSGDTMAMLRQNSCLRKRSMPRTHKWSISLRLRLGFICKTID